MEIDISKRHSYDYDRDYNQDTDRIIQLTTLNLPNRVIIVIILDRVICLL